LTKFKQFIYPSSLRQQPHWVYWQSHFPPNMGDLDFEKKSKPNTMLGNVNLTKILVFWGCWLSSTDFKK